jgi:hypothetical protein
MAHSFDVTASTSLPLSGSESSDQPDDTSESSDYAVEYSDDASEISRSIMRPGSEQQLLASLGESITDKPPYISGTLQLPDSYFSLFYKVTKDGQAARFVTPDF